MLWFWVCKILSGEACSVDVLVPLTFEPWRIAVGQANTKYEISGSLYGRPEMDDDQHHPFLVVFPTCCRPDVDIFSVKRMPQTR